MPYSATINGTTYSGNFPISTFEVVSDGKYYSAVPVIDLSQTVTGATNIGSGTGLFAQKAGQQLQFKSLVGGNGITVLHNSTGVTFNGQTIGNYVSATTFNFFTGTTAPATYLKIANFNTYSGTTEPLKYQSKSSIVTLTGTTLPVTYALKTNFNTYTGTTAPATYALKSNFNTFTGTTAPATYALISNFNSFTGTTAPATYLKISNFNTYSGVTATRLGTIESKYITGATNGLSVTGKKIKLGGTLTGATLISLGSNNLNFSGGTFSFLPNTQGSSVGGSWTATANNQTHLNFGGSFTARATASDSIAGYQFSPTVVSAAATQNLTGLLVNTTFTDTNSANQYILRLQSAGVDKFTLSSTGQVAQKIGFKAGINFPTTISLSATGDLGFNGSNSTIVGQTAFGAITAMGLGGNTTVGSGQIPYGNSASVWYLQSSSLTYNGTILSVGAGVQINGSGSNTTLKTVGAGTTTNYSIRSFQSDGTTEIFSVLDNGTASHNGNLKLTTAGNGLYVKEGSNATMGVKTLTGGTAVVSTTKVTASSRIQLTPQSNSNLGVPYISARSAGTSFTITSTNGSDASQIFWWIIEPA